jgi:response regulator RpfG family c-di-GMP phosphodiesterase
MTPPITSVLIVDDEPTVREIMSRWVAALGLESKTAANADEALALLQTHHCDLAVIDLMMPGHDGLWLANQLKEHHPHTAVVIATAHTDLIEGDSRNIPIADLLVKPVARNRFALAVHRGRQWRKQALDEVQWHARLWIELRDRVESVCAEIDHAASQGADEGDLLVKMAVDRIPDTMAHAERVARHAVAVAREFTSDRTLGAELEAAARLHDIGKIAMPESLLTKPSALTAGERAIMRRHVDAGAEILASTRSLNALAHLVLATHEWFGGGGYPLKLAGAAIPLASRIITVCDAYDVMTQGRHYRSRLDTADAVTELVRCVETQFDPDVLAVFLGILGRR